jgi:hypothetical protein
MVRRRRRHLVNTDRRGRPARPRPFIFPEIRKTRRRPKGPDVRVLHRPRHARHVPLVQLLPDQRRAFPVLPVLPRGLRAAGRHRAHGTGLRLRRRRRVALDDPADLAGWARSTPPWCAACPTSSFSSSSSSCSTRASNTCAIQVVCPDWTDPIRQGANFIVCPEARTPQSGAPQWVHETYGFALAVFTYAIVFGAFCGNVLYGAMRAVPAPAAGDRRGLRHDPAAGLLAHPRAADVDLRAAGACRTSG